MRAEGNPPAGDRQPDPGRMTALGVSEVPRWDGAHLPAARIEPDLTVHHLEGWDRQRLGACPSQV